MRTAAARGPERGGTTSAASSPQGGSTQPAVAQNLAFAERGAVLADYVTETAAKRIAQDVGPLPAGPIQAPLPDPTGGRNVGGGGGGSDGGCAHCATDPAQTGLGAAGLALLGLFGALRLRRRRSTRLEG